MKASVRKQILSIFQGETQDYEINRTQTQDKPWDLSVSQLDQWFFKTDSWSNAARFWHEFYRVPPFTYQMFSLFHFLFNTDFFFFNSWKDCVVSFKPVPFGFCLIPSAENILRTAITGAQCSEHVHNDRLMNSHRVRGLGIHRAGRETWCSHHRHVLIISVLNPRGPKQITVTLLHPHPSPWVGLGWEDVKDPAGAQRTTAQGPNLAHHLVL